MNQNFGPCTLSDIRDADHFILSYLINIVRRHNYLDNTESVLKIEIIISIVKYECQ